MGAMTRVVAAAAAIAAAGVAGVLLLGRAPDVPGVAPTAPLTVHTSFDPPIALFGDRVVANIVVLADTRALDTSKLRWSDDVAPLSRLGAAQVSRTTQGRLLTVSIAVPTVCLDDQCLADKGPMLLRLPVARAEAPRRGGGVEQASARWPVLELRGRVDSSDLARSPLPFRSDTSAPAVTYRIAPGTLAPLLDVLAALLVAGGVALAAWQLVSHARRRRSVDGRTDLERALALVREAQRRPPRDRRLAVGLLARLLRPRDAALAGDAGDLAWSEPQPGADAVAEIADRVEEA
jgi:hypothetical protein